MTKLDTVAIQQRVSLMSGVQQPATMVNDETLYPLICQMLPARLTGCYSSINPGSFGNGKRSPSPLSRTSRSFCRALDPDKVFGGIAIIFQPVLHSHTTAWLLQNLDLIWIPAIHIIGYFHDLFSKSTHTRYLLIYVRA